MDEWYNERGSDQHETPEALLYYSVLETYAIDMRLGWLHMLEPRRSKHVAFLLEEARSPWTEQLCSWLDVSHSWFVAQLEKQARDLGYENRN